MTPANSARIPISLGRDVVAARIDAFVAVASDVPNEYWAAENFLRELPAKWNLSLVLPADDGNPDAYAIASKPEPELVHLHHLMVGRESRGSGLGGVLVRELLHRAASSGAKHLRLKVHEGNGGALRFYQREGFQRVASGAGYHTLMSATRRLERRVAVHQPNYLPWCGYFSKWAKADVFVFLDDAQMPGGQSYVYRTRITGPAGAQWLSVPTRRSLSDLISGVEFASPSWPKKHLGTFRAVYGRRPFFKSVFERLEALYSNPGEGLSAFNVRTNSTIAGWLGNDKPVLLSSRLGVAESSDDRLIRIVEQLGGTTYVSGKGGQNYQDPEKFERAAIGLECRSYAPVAYEQGRAPFEPGLSVVDALFNVGPEGAARLL
jgi:ribosomal protein S18 acetylase RimI-like enzyme